MGNLTTLNHQAEQTSYHQQFSYDVMGRMTGRLEPNSGHLYESFHYDAADNLLETTVSNHASKLLNDLFERFKQAEHEYDGDRSSANEANQGINSSPLMMKGA